MHLAPVADAAGPIPLGYAPRVPSSHAKAICMVELAEQMLLQPSRAGPRTLGQTAACLGVADRTLYAAFAAVRGTSPGRYLALRRLELVREALLAEPNRRSAVKWVAISHGFHHLGNFAHTYHQRFGELPSETIARAKRDVSRCVVQEGMVDIGSGRS